MSIATDKLSVFISEWQGVSGIRLRHPTGGTLLMMEEARSLLLLDALPKLIDDKVITALDLTSWVAQYLMLHTLPLAEVRGMAGNGEAIANAMFAAAESIPAERVVEYALAINAALQAMKATRDWEVAGQSGDPFTPRSGPPSTSPKSPS
jgi:hypothetical protein